MLGKRLERNAIVYIGQGSRAAAHADVLVVAKAAFAVLALGAAEIFKEGALTPDLRKRGRLHVAGTDREIAAGLNFAGMRDEANRLATQAALRDGRISRVVAAI